MVVVLCTLSYDAYGIFCCSDIDLFICLYLTCHVMYDLREIKCMFCSVLFCNTCMKFYEHILNGFKVVEWIWFCHRNYYLQSSKGRTQRVSIQELWFFHSACHLMLVNIYTVVRRYNDHLYNGNFDFLRNFFGNRSFLRKNYYIITEFALSKTDGDLRWRNAFFNTFFIH